MTHSGVQLLSRYQHQLLVNPRTRQQPPKVIRAALPHSPWSSKLESKPCGW